MSTVPTTVDAALFRYVSEHARSEDAFLTELRAAAVATGIPAINIAPEQGAFVQVLFRLAGVREAVEVGTLAGYGAIWMARALAPGGRLRTLEIDLDRAAFARAWIGRSDVAERVEVLLGPAGETLARMEAASLDAMLLDADKSGYPAYLEHARRLLRPGGLLLADNAFAFGELLASEPRDREVPAVRAFNEIMAADEDFQAVIVPLGDGIWTAVRR